MIPRTVLDLWTIFRCQAQGVRLDLKSALLRPASPLLQATAFSVPGFGLWSGRVLSVSARGQGRGGFVQARWRTGAPVLDLLYIAPALDAQQGAAWLWQHLLHDLARVGAEHEVQRLFAHLPEQRHAEVEVMRQAGFAIYAQDRLFCLRQVPAQPPAGTVRWQPRQPVDDWGLGRLYYGQTPNSVQQAEAIGHGGGGYAGWWGSSRRGCFVVRGETAGEVLAFLQLTRGEHGHWLKLVLHPDKAPPAVLLVQEALAMMAGWPRRPIYCDVRDFEGPVGAGLGRNGFEQVMVRMLLVRHTTASARVKVARPAPALEAAPDTAPTPF